jgi:F0F1-type ATP synthase delta subunit
MFTYISALLKAAADHGPLKDVRQRLATSEMIAQRPKRLINFGQNYEYSGENFIREL